MRTFKVKRYAVGAPTPGVVEEPVQADEVDVQGDLLVFELVSRETAEWTAGSRVPPPPPLVTRRVVLAFPLALLVEVREEL